MPIEYFPRSFGHLFDKTINAAFARRSCSNWKSLATNFSKPILNASWKLIYKFNSINSIRTTNAANECFNVCFVASNFPIKRSTFCTKDVTAKAIHGNVTFAASSVTMCTNSIRICWAKAINEIKLTDAHGQSEWDCEQCEWIQFEVRIIRSIHHWSLWIRI